MAAQGRSWLFRKRLWLGLAAAAGIVIGLNLPQFWKGIGRGGGDPLGLGQGENDGPQDEDKSDNERVALVSRSAQEDAPPVVKVVIAERSFLLRTDEGDRPVDLADVVDLVQRARGDADGIRLRIYRQPSSRPSAETALQTALKNAGIDENEVLWVPAADGSD